MTVSFVQSPIVHVSPFEKKNGTDFAITYKDATQEDFVQVSPSISISRILRTDSLSRAAL